jgi:hypothetical protein
VKSFDVGGQYGYDSLMFAKHTMAPVAVFECDETYLLKVRRNFELNPGLGGLVQIVAGEVGDRGGQIRLDGWAHGAGFVPDFIKLDIDGGEVGALRSATRLMSEQKPAIVVEVHSIDLERECGRLLCAPGYDLTIVNQRRVWPDWRPGAHNRWLVSRAN